MDKEQQNIIVEGLTLLVEECIEKTNKVIVDDNFDSVKTNLGFGRNIFRIIDSLGYFPAQNYTKLQDSYNVVIRAAERIFVEEKRKYKGFQNQRELIEVIER